MMIRKDAWTPLPTPPAAPPPPRLPRPRHPAARSTWAHLAADRRGTPRPRALLAIDPTVRGREKMTRRGVGTAASVRGKASRAASHARSDRRSAAARSTLVRGGRGRGRGCAHGDRGHGRGRAHGGQGHGDVHGGRVPRRSAHPPTHLSLMTLTKMSSERPITRCRGSAHGAMAYLSRSPVRRLDAPCRDGLRSKICAPASLEA